MAKLEDQKHKELAKKAAEQVKDQLKDDKKEDKAKLPQKIDHKPPVPASKKDSSKMMIGMVLFLIGIILLAFAILTW